MITVHTGSFIFGCLCGGVFALMVISIWGLVKNNDRMAKRVIDLEQIKERRNDSTRGH